MDLTSQQIRRIERLALEGVGQRRIARAMAVSQAAVEDCLTRSQIVNEHWAVQAERRRHRDEAFRRLTCSDMGRASDLYQLPEHRDALGRIDWQAVKGYESWREIAREAAREELAAA